MSYAVYQKGVGGNIRKARLKANLTQEQMAKFGFNIRHFQDIEGGKIKITLHTLYRLSKALKTPTQDLAKESF